ncbi:MAG: hypothetical protein ACKOB3_00285 [Holophagaceae bacterium]
MKSLLQNKPLFHRVPAVSWTLTQNCMTHSWALQMPEALSRYPYGS